MSVSLNPYLSFRGAAREALDFYRSVLGGELAITTFSEGGMSQGPDDADLVMHGQITTPLGLVLMAADTPDSMPLTVGDNVTVSLSGTGSVDELTSYWNGLADGATVTMAFEKAPWGDTFGMLVDRFGINWMVNASPDAA